MNGYERVKAALSGRGSDYRPVMLHNFQHCIYEAGITFDEFRSEPVKAAECFIKNVEKYDLDGVFIDFDTAVLAEACGCQTAFPPDHAAVVTSAVLRDVEETGNLKKVDLENSRRVMNWLETSRLVSDYFKDSKYVRCNCDQAPFSLASMLRGSQDFMMDLIDEDNEESIMELLSYCEDVTEQFVRLASQTGAHGVSNGDSVAGPAMISPEMYQKYAMPFEIPVIQAAHENGMDYILHICGDTTLILEQMAKLPLEGLELDYKTDMKKMHDILAGKITVSGNLDPSSVFYLGDECLVREKVRELLDVYSDSNRLIVCSGCALSTETPSGNIYAFVDEARERRF